MKPIVLWDVMSTLVHDPFFEEMPEFFDMRFEELVRSLQPGAWVEFELAERTEGEFLRDFFADGRQFDHRGFVETVRSSYRWLPGMETLMHDLRGSGCTMHTFSNYPVWYQMIEERLGVSRFADWTFVSCLTGLRKPDPAAYAHALRSLDVEANDCIFIDDQASNCEAAREAGLSAIRFRGADDLRDQLQRTGAL
jgi:HAD superfamily hydrolase (TIGR01509 family)